MCFSQWSLKTLYLSRVYTLSIFEITLIRAALNLHGAYLKWTIAVVYFVDSSSLVLNQYYQWFMWIVNYSLGAVCVTPFEALTHVTLGNYLSKCCSRALNLLENSRTLYLYILYANVTLRQAFSTTIQTLLLLVCWLFTIRNAIFILTHQFIYSYSIAYMLRNVKN